MIEIALSIAIVAFAMVAIMGVLPTGLNVQKENRDDTLISQDGPFLIDAIRNGVTNLTDISNNLVWIELRRNNLLIGGQRYYQSNYNLSSRQIIGYMSTPKVEPGTTNLLSLRARFLANSGGQAQKASTTRDLAFSYLLSSEVVPFTPTPGLTTNVYDNLVTNLYEIRVEVRWPVYGAGSNDTNTGNYKQVFRALSSGHLRQEVVTNVNLTNTALYFFEPSVFAPAY